MSNLINFRSRTNDSQIAITVLVLALVTGLFWDSVLGALIFFLSINFICTLFVPSNFSIQRYAICCVSFIGLAPIYLVVRGFFSQEALTNVDLQIYGVVFVFVFAFLYKFGKPVENHMKKKLPDVSYVIASLGALLFSLIMQFFLMNKSVGHAVAWIASGDSKNHAVNGVTLFELGFLDPRTFLTQPSSSPTFLSLFLSELDVDSSEFKTNLALLMQTYTFVWILLIGILGLTISALLEIVWGNIGETKEMHIPKVLLFATSLIATFSFAIGPALYDGFFTAIFGITTVTLMISWYLEISNKNNFELGHIFIGLLIFLSSVFAWMFVLPFTGILFLAGVTDHLTNKYINKLKIFFGVGIGVIFLFLVAHFSDIGQEFIFKSKTALNTTGAVNASPPKVSFILICVIIIFGLVLKDSNKKFGKALLTVAATYLVALLLFKSFSNLSIFSWNYYLLKYQWIIFVSLFSLIFVTAITKIMSFSLMKNWNRLVVMLLVFFITFGISELSVTSNRVWQKIWAGWENPRSQAIDRMFQYEIDIKTPTLFFHHGYGGDAMLVNFWLTAFTDPIEPIKGWNYSIDTTGDVKQMCDVKYYYPKVRLITSDSMLENDLKSACPKEQFTVVLDTPLY